MPFSWSLSKQIIKSDKTSVTYLDEVPLEVQQVFQQCGNVGVDTFSLFLNHLVGPLGDHLSMGGLATCFRIYTEELSLKRKEKKE